MPTLCAVAQAEACMASPAGRPSAELASCHSAAASPATFLTQAVRGAKRKSLAAGSPPAGSAQEKRTRSGEITGATDVPVDEAADVERSEEATFLAEERLVSHAGAEPSGVQGGGAPAGMLAPLLNVFSSQRGHGVTAAVAAEPAGPPGGCCEPADPACRAAHPAERHSTDSEDTGHNDENATDHAGVSSRGGISLQTAHCPSHALHAHHPPPPDVPEAAESELEEESEGGELLCEFDPILFIKTLPPLDSVVREARMPLLPKQTRVCKQKTLVLDLDETLVHSSLEPVGHCDFSFAVHFNSMEHQIHVRKRPHLEAFMERVSQLFEIVVFTASQKIYAEKLLNIIDPTRTLIKHRIYRDSCVVVDGNYLKDLSVLGRDLRSTIIVDNSPQAFGFQLDNGVPIESWYDDDSDDELLKLLPFLEALVDVEDVRPSIAQKFRLRELVARATF